MRGRLGLARREGASAVKHYRAALDAEPDNADAIFGMGQAPQMTGDAAAARPFLEESKSYVTLGTLISRVGLKSSRTDPAFMRSLGTACERVHRIPQGRPPGIGWPSSSTPSTPRPSAPLPSERGPGEGPPRLRPPGPRGSRCRTRRTTLPCGRQAQRPPRPDRGRNPDGSRDGPPRSRDHARAFRGHRLGQWGQSPPLHPRRARQPSRTRPDRGRRRGDGRRRDRRSTSGNARPPSSSSKRTGGRSPGFATRA